MKSSTPKQFISINGVSVLSHTIERLLQVKALKSIVVVLDETTFYSEGLSFESPSITTCIGGNSRAESVKNGLLHLESMVDHDSQVLVHDAARPCVRVGDIHRLISETAGDDNGGLLAMPVVDTIKRANATQHVIETVDRNQLWRAATPQLFSYPNLLRALMQALEEGINITDEASAMQNAGFSPRLVECSADNIKVTTPTDLALAEHYLSVQRAELA